MTNNLDNEFTYRFVNCTSFNIWMVDGSNSGPMLLPPNIGPNGENPTNIPVQNIGSIVLCGCNLQIQNSFSEMGAQSNSIWDFKYSRVIATLNNVDNIESWNAQVKDYNIIFFGCEKYALTFFEKYGSYYNYILQTDYGTRFANSANYGILNCTGKTLYQVDDTAIEDVGQSDIVVIPSGDNIVLPLWLNQKYNDANNNAQEPCVRAYRYTMLPLGDGKFNGFMREHIYKWDNYNLGEKGFLYIPYHHMCLFDDKNAAENFVKKYKTVERYHAYISVEKICDDIQEAIDDRFKKQELRNKKIMYCCAVTLSLGVAKKAGEAIYKYLTKTKK